METEAETKLREAIASGDGSRILARLVRAHGRDAWRLAQGLDVRLDFWAAADVGLDEVERPFFVADEQGNGDEVWASSPEEALATVDPEEWVDLHKGPFVGTYWAICRVTGEQEARQIVLDQAAPPCCASDHAWSDSSKLIVSSRPSEGGGRRYRAVCLRCGTVRVVDTGYVDRYDGTIVDGAVTYYEQGGPAPEGRGEVRTYRNADDRTPWRVRFDRDGRVVRVWPESEPEPDDDDVDAA